MQREGKGGVRGRERGEGGKITLDDTKQTANWGRSIQSIHEEVGTGGQCSMWSYHQ